MEMDNTPNNKKQGKNAIWRIFLSNFVILLLIAIGFAGGMYYAGNNQLGQELAREGTVFVGQVLGKYSQPDDKGKQLGKDVDFDLYWETWDKLEKYYVDRDEVTDKELFYGSLQGMVDAVDDPYTVFMNPKKSQDFDKSMEGEEKFEGIGAEIGMKQGVLTIIAPLPGMPAEKAGLKPGDKVISINGESTSDITIDEAVDRIRGKKGTTVTLSIARESWDDIRDIDIQRGSIVVHTVRPRMRDDGYYEIQITNFNDDTEQAFNEAVQEAVESKPKGIILDLRSNPGGYLDTAIEVASEWLNDELVVTEKYSQDKKIEHLSRGRARLQDIPTAVLINQGSASASEIVAGALQDHGQAVVVGEKTFGKGSVQRLVNLNDGSSIKITVAKWLTPDGRSINDEGIQPDVSVEYTEEDFNQNKDPQMKKAIGILKGEVNVPAQAATNTPAMTGTSTDEQASSTDE